MLPRQKLQDLQARILTNFNLIILYVIGKYTVRLYNILKFNKQRWKLQRRNKKQEPERKIGSINTKWNFVG